MKLRWKLSRGKRTVLNLLLTALLLTLIWGLRGYPLPTTELEFRRLERENLLPRSEIILNGEDTLFQWRDLPNLRLSSTSLVVGIEDGWVYTANLVYDSMECWPLEPGITPVPLYNASAYVFEPGNPHSGIPLLFLNVPEEAERAEIHIDAEGRSGGSRWYDGEGWRAIPGGWIFCASPGNAYYGDWYANGSYTLRLYQADGSLLLEQSGTLAAQP